MIDMTYFGVFPQHSPETPHQLYAIPVIFHPLPEFKKPAIKLFGGAELYDSFRPRSPNSINPMLNPCNRFSFFIGGRQIDRFGSWLVKVRPS